MSKQYGSLDINNKLIWNLRDIGHTMRHISEGKGSQKRILIVLNETGSMTQRELTQWLGIQPGSVSEVIGKLESSGLIERTPSMPDRRTMDICLTQSGKIQAEEARTLREERHDQMFSCLCPEEKELLLSLLEKLNHDWNRQYRENETESGTLNYGKGRGHQKPHMTKGQL